METDKSKVVHLADREINNYFNLQTHELTKLMRKERNKAMRRMSLFLLVSIGVFSFFLILFVTLQGQIANIIAG